MAYCCPQCGFAWNRKDFYRMKRDGSMKILEKVVDVSDESKYPILKDKAPNFFTKVLTWREIIFCPSCRVEVEYEMNEIKAREISNDSKRNRKN